MKSRMLAATAVALLPFVGMTQDQKSPPPRESESAQDGTFESLDANKDGRISMPEAAAYPRLVESFSRADKNSDGYLDSVEFETGSAPPRQ